MAADSEILKASHWRGEDFEGLGDVVEAMKALPFPTASVTDEIRFTNMADAEQEDYLKMFLPPRLTERGYIACVGCGNPLSGLIVGTFEWGLSNGEGHCGVCRYPTRMYHRFVPVGDQDEVNVTFPLQWHPDGLEKR